MHSLFLHCRDRFLVISPVSTGMSRIPVRPWEKEKSKEDLVTIEHISIKNIVREGWSFG